MTFLRQNNEVRNVGGQKVPVYCSGIDEGRYDNLIRDFCLKYYDEPTNRYVCPVDEKNSLCLPKNYYFFFLFLILRMEKIVEKGRNVRPFMDKMKTLLVDKKYVIDRTGLSRLFSECGEDLITLTTGLSFNTDISRAKKAMLEELHPDFLRLRKIWQEYTKV